MTAGILVSIATACFVTVQASAAGAGKMIATIAAAVMAAVMAAIWVLAIDTLFAAPDLWERLPGRLAQAAGFAALGAAAFTWGAGDLIAKITAFKKKYPDR